MQINSNNFLIWEGSFNDAPFVVEAHNDIAQSTANAGFVITQPFTNDFATFGIDYNYLEITTEGNPANPSIFDAVAKTLKLFVPSTGNPGDTFIWKYRIKDTIGNMSNIATITLTIVDRNSGWRPRSSSYACLKDVTGQNTGFARYALLERYYLDDNSLYSPETIKNNDPADPDYVADILDAAACPVIGAATGLYVWNAFDTAIIKTIRLWQSGVEKYAFSINFKSSDNQPLQLQIVTGTYDVYVMVDSRGTTSGGILQIIPGVNGNSSQQQNVDADTPPVILEFNNVQFGNPFAGDITLNGL